MSIVRILTRLFLWNLLDNNAVMISLTVQFCDSITTSLRHSPHTDTQALIDCLQSHAIPLSYLLSVFDLVIFGNDCYHSTIRLRPFHYSFTWHWLLNLLFILPSAHCLLINLDMINNRQEFLV